MYLASMGLLQTISRRTCTMTSHSYGYLKQHLQQKYSKCFAVYLQFSVLIMLNTIIFTKTKNHHNKSLIILHIYRLIEIPYPEMDTEHFTGQHYWHALEKISSKYYIIRHNVCRQLTIIIVCDCSRSHFKLVGNLLL